MADKIWIDSHWWFDHSKDAWMLTGPGAYLIAEAPEIILEVNSRQVEMLIRKLDDAGWIKPRLDERLRAEDLKITHRLLDIIEHKGGK